MGFPAPSFPSTLAAPGTNLAGVTLQVKPNQAVTTTGAIEIDAVDATGAILHTLTLSIEPTLGSIVLASDAGQIQLQSGASNYGFQAAGTLLMPAGGLIAPSGPNGSLNMTANGTGTLTLLTNAARKLAFFAGAGSVRTAAYTQTYVTATRNVNSPTAVDPGALVVAGAVAPFGFSSAADFNTLVTAVRNLITDLANVKQGLNTVIDDGQAYGFFA